MPIVSHEVKTTVNVDGSQYVVVRYYDQDATEYMQSFHAPVDTDVAAIAANRIPELDEQLAQQEFEALIGQDS